MGAFRLSRYNRRMNSKKEKRLRVLGYVSFSMLVLVTAIILVMVAQMPETVFVPHNGTGPQVNK